MTLSDLEKWDAKGLIYTADLHNYARTVWPRVTKFSMTTHVGEGRF